MNHAAWSYDLVVPHDALSSTGLTVYYLCILIHRNSTLGYLLRIISANR